MYLPQTLDRIMFLLLDLVLVSSQICATNADCLWHPQPFSRYAVNPSWLAVKPLHNIILKADITIESVSSNGQFLTVDPDGSLVTREIHITALQVPVTYEAVLSILPGLHSRPPVLPSVSDLPLLSPPPDGYDLFFHVGVMDSPSLRLERLGHKFGYEKKDAAGALAPIVCMSQEEASRQHYGVQHMEMTKPRDDDFPSAVDANETPRRGFGKGYESFAEELYTDIDVDGLVQHLKKCGIEVSIFSLAVYHSTHVVNA